MTSEEIQQWTEAYISAQLDPNLTTTDDHPHWWAVEKFMNPGAPDTTAHDCLQAILRVLAMNRSNDVLGVLAAGPLEDLIDYCGDEIIDNIEIEASCSPAFRALLRGIYKSGTPAVWSRVEACRRQ